MNELLLAISLQLAAAALIALIARLARHSVKAA
jgi:hypothetical protein